MPNTGPRAGIECKLYFNAAVAATFSVASPTLITEVKDLNVTLNKTKIDITSRASRWKAAIPGAFDIGINFSLQYNADPNDTVFTTLRQAFLADTILHWAVMDNIVASPGPSGSQGITLPGIIYEFPIDQPLEDGMKIDIAVSLARTKIGSPAVLVDPAWLIVAPSA